MTDQSTVTVELTLTVDEQDQDLIVAYLSDLGFEGFLQDDHQLKAYINAEHWLPDLEERVTEMLASIDPSINSEIASVPEQNWNAQWEASVNPVEIGDFLITPSWKVADVDTNRHIVLVIDPKMSFGTGYHATTRLMLQLLPSVIRPGDRVLDAGTGTGILAIAAGRLGAASVIAIDTDPWSERNAKENCRKNDVTDVVTVQLGDVSSLPESRYDLILANIHLEVILKSLPDMSKRLNPGGRLLLSGILIEQSAQVLETTQALGLKTGDIRVENEWWSVALESDLV